MSAALTERNSHVHPTLQGIVNSLAPREWFRIEIDWPGGGFAVTLQFADRAAAVAYAEKKAKGHEGAVISVELRETVLLRHDHAFAAARYSGSLQETNDRRALLLQIAAQDRAGRSA